MTALEDARQRFTAERSDFQAVATKVKGRLTKLLRASGIQCRVEGRAKELHSLLLKMINKGKTYEQINDKAGVRIVLAYPDDRDKAGKIILAEYPTAKVEDHSRPKDPTRFLYSGLHFDITTRAESRELACEIQLHTPGESMWATLAHDLIYKEKDTPYDQIRDAHRLRALVELFDLESIRLRESLDELDMAHERAILRTLLKHYMPLVASQGRLELSLEIIRDLENGLPVSDVAQLDGLLTEFVTKYAEKLSHIYDRIENQDEPLLYQPESLLMFFMIARDPTSLADRWPERLPQQTPRTFGTLWGVPGHDPESLD